MGYAAAAAPGCHALLCRHDLVVRRSRVHALPVDNKKHVGAMTHVPAERCLSIIQFLADNAEEVPLGTIAEELDLPKSGAHRLLATLVEQGWAKQDPQTGFYQLTMRLTILGQRFYVASGLPDICQPILDNLAAVSHEYVRLAVVDSDALVWVANAQGASGGLIYQPVLATDNVPLHATASGKAWLATLPVDRAVKIVLNSPAFSSPDDYGPNVARSVTQVMENLEKVRASGVATVANEAEHGVSAMAAVVHSGEEGPAVGTVSIAGPSVRLNEQRIAELVPALETTTSELSKLWPLRRRTEQHQNKAVVRSRANA